jgi:hypothetical protein
MTFIVARISLESEITKEQMRCELATAIKFLRKSSKQRIAVCENIYELALILRIESDDYIQIDTCDPGVILVPVMDKDTGLEELIPQKWVDNIDCIRLTTCEARKHDVERNEWSALTDKLSELCDALESYGMFYE